MTPFAGAVADPAVQPAAEDEPGPDPRAEIDDHGVTVPAGTRALGALGAPQGYGLGRTFDDG
jgi:hypothetical protein